uniref:Fibronectin-like n=1 Tax=Saccoglossus kowalevskii TaxID=10224 RepID=A0ABM0M5F8_SACKO|nr:PREDICTED: fibronectin-like [Saccoglossus kowalevskii]
MFTDMTPTSISFMWEAALGDFDYYEISYSLVNGVMMVAGNVDENTLSYTLENLNTDTEYTVSVVTVIGSGDDKEMSEVSMANNVTDAIQPDVILVLDVTTTSITIEWGETEIPGATNYAALATPVLGGNTATHVVGIEDSNQHTFTGLLVGTQYRIKLQIVVTDSDDSETTINQFTRPNAPGSITVGTVTPNELPVTWIAAAGDYDFIYELSYAANGGVQTIVDTVDKSVTSYVIDGLQPDTSYDVTVIAKVGTGDEAMLSDSSVVTASTAVILPGQIIVTSVSFDAIDIIWGGSNTANGYFLSLDPPDDENTYPAFLLNTGTQYSFSGLVPGKLYTITITYSNTELDDAVAQIRTVPKPPGMITVVDSQPTEISFSWLPAEGDFSNYQISYTPDGGLKVSEATVETSVTSYTIRELNPSTMYTLEIVTSVGTGTGLTTSAPSTADVTTTSIPEGKIEVRTVTTTSIRILWGVTSQQNYGYLLDLNPRDGGTYPLVESDSSEYTFLNLIPGREYTIKLTVNGLQDVGDEITQATKPNAPVGFSVDSYTPTTITVQWSTPNGEVSAYILSYTDPDGQLNTAGTMPTVITAGVIVIGEVTTSSISILWGASTSSTVSGYLLSITPYDGSGVMFLPTNVISYTFGDLVAAVITAGVIVIGEVTTSSISILWGASNSSTVSGYLLSITPYDGSGVMFLPTNVISYTFGDLVAGREYTITLQLAGPNTQTVISVRTSKDYIKFITFTDKL